MPPCGGSKASGENVVPGAIARGLSHAAVAWYQSVAGANPSNPLVHRTRQRALEAAIAALRDLLADAPTPEARDTYQDLLRITQRLHDSECLLGRQGYLDDVWGDSVR
jgi:hypothetical protein